MQRKLRLLKSDKYAFHVCTYMMAEMVVEFLEGRQGPKWLGCEQGIVEGWDDVVQELGDGSLRHTQVKRQLSDFSKDSADRFKPPKAPKGTSKKSPGAAISSSSAALTPPIQAARKLSAFDESIAALAKWSSLPAPPDGKIRWFIIQVPDWNTGIKDEFATRQFEYLCELCRNPTTNAKELEAKAKQEASLSNMYQWLTTWCGFKDWQQIFDALKYLTIEVPSLEPQIIQASESLLHPYFDPVSDVIREIHHYLEDNVTDTGAATPRQILALVRNYLRPDVHVWTQYAMDELSTAWGVSGLAGGHATNIEFPADTVPIYWRGSSTTTTKLKICLKFEYDTLSKDSLACRLMRLALHVSSPGYVSLAGVQNWNTAVSAVLANTLGVTPNDLNVRKLSWVEAKDILTWPDTRHLPGIAEVRIESTALECAMGIEVWRMLKTEVAKKIQAMTSSGDLQLSVDQLWQKLAPALDADHSALNRLMNEMLSPVSEGLGHLGALRVGPNTVSILSEGILMLMITAVALGRDVDITALIGGKDIRAIASAYWGGPSGANRRPRALIADDDDAEIEVFLGKEIAQIVVLSQVMLTPSEVNRPSISADRLTPDSFGSPRRARLAVSNSQQFRRAVRTGEIKNVARLLNPELLARDDAREQNITKVELTK